MVLVLLRCLQIPSARIALYLILLRLWLVLIHVELRNCPVPVHRRTGRGGAGGAVAPPIRAVCRHEFGQRVDIIRAKHNTCLNNTNLGSVTGVNGKKTRI